MAEALVLARALRGVAATAVDLSGRSLKAALRVAARSGARVAVILGDDELASGQVAVRDLVSGVQKRHPQGELVGAVRALLERDGGAG